LHGTVDGVGRVVGVVGEQPVEELLGIRSSMMKETKKEGAEIVEGEVG
jgi:hypothetical protein